MSWKCGEISFINYPTDTKPNLLIIFYSLTTYTKQQDI